MSEKEWREHTVAHLSTRIAMGPFGSNIKAENFENKGVPVIRGSNLNYSKYVSGDFVYLTENKAHTLQNSICHPDDIVITHRGTLGQVCLVPQGKFREYVVSQSGMFFSVNKEIADSDFIFYYFKSSIGQFEILKNESQVGVPSISNPLTSLKKATVLLPPLPEQKAIAEVLSSLDDKINLLNRQNTTLEALAQTYFRKWFVENETQTGRLDSIANVTMGQSPKGDSYNEVGFGTVFFQGGAEFGWRFPTTRLYTTSPQRLAKKNDILMSVRAPVGDINIAVVDCCIGRGLAAIRSEYPTFTLYALKGQNNQLDIFNGEGTVFGSISKEGLNGLSIPIPSKKTILEFENRFSVLDEKIKANSEQIRTLTALRDTLLPKLISGEVRVKR